MSKINNRNLKAQNKALERGLDCIIDTYETPDFVEIMGKKGGDTITLRIYDNGTITER